jgi:hypothetical protein
LSGSVQRVRESCWQDAARNPNPVAASMTQLKQIEIYCFLFLSLSLKTNPKTTRNQRQNKQQLNNSTKILGGNRHERLATHRWPNYWRREPTTTPSRVVETWWTKPKGKKNNNHDTGTLMPKITLLRMDELQQPRNVGFD